VRARRERGSGERRVSRCYFIPVFSGGGEKMRARGRDAEASPGRLGGEEEKRGRGARERASGGACAPN